MGVKGDYHIAGTLRAAPLQVASEAMTAVTSQEIVELFIAVLRHGDEHAFDELSEALAENVEFVSTVTGPTLGRADVVAVLRRFQAEGRFTRATGWVGASEPGILRAAAAFPLGSFYARYGWDLEVDMRGRVTRITQSGVAQTEPSPESPVKLDDGIASALQFARETRNPLIVAYIDSKGQSSQAPRGTVQVFSADQLALWVHNRHGGLATAIASNESVSLHYWGGIGTRFGGTLLFQGRAHVDDSERIRRQVYDNSPLSEQRSDPHRLGCPVIIDLNRVRGFLAEPVSLFVSLGFRWRIVSEPGRR